MRIFPIALIVAGMLGLARHFGLIPVGAWHVIGPSLLIALGVALLLRRPRGCRSGWSGRRPGNGAGAAASPAQPARPV